MNEENRFQQSDWFEKALRGPRWLQWMVLVQFILTATLFTTWVAYATYDDRVYRTSSSIPSDAHTVPVSGKGTRGPHYITPEEQHTLTTAGRFLDYLGELTALYYLIFGFVFWYRANSGPQVADEKPENEFKQ